MAKAAMGEGTAEDRDAALLEARSAAAKHRVEEGGKLDLAEAAALDERRMAARKAEESARREYNEQALQAAATASAAERARAMHADVCGMCTDSGVDHSAELARIRAELERGEGELAAERIAERERRKAQLEAR